MTTTNLTGYGLQKKDEKVCSWDLTARLQDHLTFILNCGKVFSGDLINDIDVKEVENVSTHELANSLNKAFLEPLEEYRLFCLITRVALAKNLPEFLEVFEERVWKILAKLIV